jgi:hypothetical protein
VRALELPPGWEPIAVKGSKDSTFAPMENFVTPSGAITVVEGRLWQGGKLLVWKPAATGDTLKFAFPIETAGNYVVRFVAARTPHAGTIGVKLNGQPAGFGGKEGSIKLHDPWRVMLDAFGQETVALEAGTQTLEITYLGAPESAEHPVHIGLDFLWLQRK